MRKVSALLLAAERRAISGLAGLYASRMLGLFMVLPVLALYADTLTGATPLLVGVALGIYGLTQATLQIPFGLLSDRIGRKRVIAMGLLIFAFGSVVAAMADSIGGVILGRALQGGGAVAAAIMALLADQTREQVRTAAMATIGLSIGVSFAIAMVLGPWLASWAGLSGVFWFTALLTLVGLLVLWRWVPPAPRRLRHRDVGLDRKQFKSVITRPDLWRLDLSIFALHLVLMAIFVAIPFRLLNAGVAVEYHGLAYLGIMALSFVAMVPLVIIAEKRQRMRLMCLLAIGAIAASLASLGLSLSQGHWLFVWLFVFFTGFNLLEATLPSMLSKLAPAGAKGTAMGVYSTSQFLGAFLGGTLGGLLANTWGLNAVFIGCAVLALAWWVAMWRMPSPPPLSSKVVALHDTQPDAINLLMEHLADVVGVEDVMVVPEERLMYLKVNRKELDQAALAKLIPPPRP
ncbi:MULTISPECIES: MFS transporter [Halomonadaceae]|jgi:MFS family permease|uniref:MFS transporter n=1 Tax=Halomonadaceae TaxID=28256 RepID=UPI001D18B00D|nr:MULTISPECIES: MFS transporter [Halomonas]MCC4286243.1 MFS transporter [Halomonas meridiana]MCP1302636.1 MFS transporter [Halomonas sp. R1t8]MCP1330305.1 MFS transporter [Halomonas sp. R1t4]|tara:strand:- start:2672 stop:4051 length:1380 start_codon:yes stop_codon:yes gene_type:complete